MVFGFINQSDGHMTIDSVQGQGTTVSLYLPRHNSGEQKIQPSEQQSDPLPTGQGETILLVEDEPSVQQMIADALDILGYGTVRVNTASDALHKLEQQGHEIDLIVSDVVLPGGINGLELGAEVKKPFPGARVLFISGYAQDALAQCGTDVNEVEVLHKPFSIRKLAEQISKLLDT
jgi:CheY-like chemotaxis protein